MKPIAVPARTNLMIVPDPSFRLIGVSSTRWRLARFPLVPGLGIHVPSIFVLNLTENCDGGKR